MEQVQEWQFGAFRLLPEQRLTLDGKIPVCLGGHVLDVLIVLVEAAGKVVGRDELMASVWKKVVVDEGSLLVHVAAERPAGSERSHGASVRRRRAAAKLLTNFIVHGICNAMQPPSSLQSRRRP